ncbi:MAG TPA: nitrite reductase (NAD(P)H), partial [Nocardioides sp.]
REIVVDDALGLGSELEAAMARHVDSYFDEWKATIDDPDKLARFVSFVNAPDTPDPHIAFRAEREQAVPEDSSGPVVLGATIPVGAPR